jgi:hypothetical protein
MSRHLWEQWVDLKEDLTFLRKAQKRLESAWKCDGRDPKSYPINTSYALAEIEESLSIQPRDTNFTVRASKEPRSLAELVPEELIKTVWEEHHAGTFEEAIRQAAGVSFAELPKSWKAFQGIIRAMETAYLASFFGDEFLPKPKVSILHRGLARITRAAGLELETDAAFAEFLDGFCPCGIRRHKEAVRKLSSRSARISRPKI